MQAVQLELPKKISYHCSIILESIHMFGTKLAWRLKDGSELKR